MYTELRKKTDVDTNSVINHVKKSLLDKERGVWVHAADGVCQPKVRMPSLIKSSYALRTSVEGKALFRTIEEPAETQAFELLRRPSSPSKAVTRVYPE